MFKAVTSPKIAPGLLIGALILIFGACTTTESSADTSNDQPQPTSTPITIEVTVGPTPAPTTIVDPIGNSVSVEALPIKPLPAALDPDQITAQPTEQQVVDLWTDYLTDSLVTVSLINPALGDIHFCQNGVIKPERVGLTYVPWFDQPDSWFIERNAAMSASIWWEAALVIRIDPASTYPAATASVMTLSVEDGKLRSTAQFSADDIPVYESETCKQLSS
jgi:hypothetical protein